MPHSLVLNLLPASPVPVGYLSDKHLHALFPTLVSLVDRTLGDRELLYSYRFDMKCKNL